jgi:hypothetical protein
MYMLYIRSGRQVHMYLHMYARMYGRLRAPVACIPACVYAPSTCLCMSVRACARERRRNATARPLDVCHHVCMCMCGCMHVHMCVRVDSMQACASRHVRLCLEACTGALVRTRASAAPSAVVCSPYPRACAYVWMLTYMRVPMARHRRARIGMPV